MKKVLIIAAAALFIGSTAQAQDVMKQTGGETNLEVLFAPLGGSPIGINGIKIRKFTSATTAIRGTVFLGLSTETEKMMGGTEGNTELKESSSEFNISVQPGLEIHFVGTDRLSPYYGAEAIIGFGKTGDKAEQIYDADNNFATIKTSSQGNLTIGLNAIAGMDFYFADNIYLGAELGFGIAYNMEMKETMENLKGDGTETIETSEAPGGSSINIGPNVVGAIRLGFLF